MKASVIKDFNKLLKEANVGHYNKYESILEKISFIELGGKFPDSTKIYYHLMTN